MNYSSISDKELIREYQSGKEACIQHLISRHKNKIFTYILFTVKNRALADDLFQDTFFKVIKTLKNGSYNEEGKFGPWATRIAHNLIIDHYRKAKRIPVIENSDEYDIFDTIKSYDDSTEEKIVNQQIREQVKDLIEHLPEEQREVLQMRHYAEMSFKDISEQTGVSINTALGRMRYALINLRKLIEENNLNLSV